MRGVRELRPQTLWTKSSWRSVGCTPRGSCDNMLPKRVLTRFSRESAFEKVLRRFLEGVLQQVLKGEMVLRRVLRRGFKKGLSRRRIEGRSTLSWTVRPLRVRPSLGFPLVCQPVGFFPNVRPRKPNTLICLNLR